MLRELLKGKGPITLRSLYSTRAPPFNIREKNNLAYNFLLSQPCFVQEQVRRTTTRKNQSHPYHLFLSQLQIRTNGTMTAAGSTSPVQSPKVSKPHVYRRLDYKPPAYWIRHVDLAVRLHSAEKTEVLATLCCERNAGAGHKRPTPLLLDCDEMLNVEEIAVSTSAASSSTPLSSTGAHPNERKILSPHVDYAFSGKGEERKLTILESELSSSGDATSTFQLHTRVTFNPEANKTCMGLYLCKLADGSSLHCTQMEAEGFRKFSPFPDRPDVMAKYRVRIEADKISNPVLLSNGNLVSEGAVSGKSDWHYAIYEDPHSKPSYLFALVAGKLAYIEEKLTTAFVKRQVTLRVYAEEAVKHLLRHSLDSLIRAIKFDERFFHLEYDLDVFNIVSVKDFNMGAMENKSLNVFNEKLILASQDTATDVDYERIESVVAHEYFHNWSGNRVTCRDWFQLTLKEGLTVFRDQIFSINDGLFGVAKRIDQVRDMLEVQFPEDAGALAHPVRPESYEKIDNFYTATVYEKGAEVIRMYYTILGEAGFKKGLAKYFELHDGTAATCDDFLKSMEIGGGADLTLFSKWLSTKGTPTLDVKKVSADAGKAVELVFEQAGAGSAVKEILHVPVAYGLINAKTGKELQKTEVFHLKEKKGSVRIVLPAGVAFDDVVPSVNRGFGAPVKLVYTFTPEELGALAAYDTDMYCKYSAYEHLCSKVIYEVYGNGKATPSAAAEAKAFKVLESSLSTLLSSKSDAENAALVLGKTIGLPDAKGLLFGYGKKVDPILLADSVDAVREALISKLGRQMRAKYESTPGSGGDFSLTPQAIGNRLLRNTLLVLLQDGDLAQKQYWSAKTMTEKVAAFRVLVEAQADSKLPTGKSASANSDFYEFAKKSNSGPVMDKWFSLQAWYTPNFSNIQELVKHSDFSVSNPNRFRSVVASVLRNPKIFYSDAGRDFVKDQILALDKFGNGQVAARMCRAFEVKAQVTPEYATKIDKALKSMLTVPDLKSETKEIITKILG
ncbi:unnamed protein product [Amoebophrya sp. A25]|nr:unnamed protein product [Amoebophrya sp. A25]|eukprot:GSA25T00004554001.1